ncbi:peptidylprolyl isomerase fpr3 [Marasmius sp. AFHP31]|nr:peptidylprolyl isomerase fpr3 [Marasmius sp. AFHP31]
MIHISLPNPKNFTTTLSQSTMHKFWTTTILANRALTFVPDLPLRLTNAALGSDVVDFASRTTLFVRESVSLNGANVDRRAAVTSLKAGSIESATFDVYLTPGTAYTLEIEGTNPISVIGYYKRVAVATRSALVPRNAAPAIRRNNDAVPAVRRNDNAVTPVRRNDNAAPIVRQNDDENRKRKREQDNDGDTAEENRKLKQVKRTDANTVTGSSRNPNAVAGSSRNPQTNTPSTNPKRRKQETGIPVTQAVQQHDEEGSDGFYTEN